MNKRGFRLWRTAVMMATTVLCIGGTVFGAPRAIPIPITKTTPTSSKIFINGNEVSFQAYNIDGASYVRPRDLAFSLNDTEKQFDVYFESMNWSVNLLTNRAYTIVGREMSKGDGQIKDAAFSGSRFLLDGKEISLAAYFIDNSDYFKLRNIAKMLNFAIDWDETNNAIMIDTSKPYSKIESVTYIISPTEGFRGNMITYETRVYASGYILKKATNDFDEIQFQKMYSVDKDSIHDLFDSFYKNGFFDWPDNLSTDSCDGDFIYFVVEAENDSYKKGGLNPYFEGFENCKEIFDKCIHAGSIITLLEGDSSGITDEVYIKKMKELGWPDDYINETIRGRDEAAKKGIIVPLEMHLFEAPIND